MINQKTNERELAYTVKVSETKELPNYTNVHYVKVLEWWCVAPKDIKSGDLVIYFEIDSKLPSNDARFAFMEKRKFLVKTIKICGVVSQGLVLSLDQFPELKDCKEGDFVTDKLHIEKYEPDVDNESQNKSSVQRISPFQRAVDRHKKFFNNPLVKVLMKFKSFRWLIGKLLVRSKDKNKSKWPDWLPKTGSERIQNLPQLLGSNEPYIITEKCDGASTSFILDENSRYLVGSHNVIKSVSKKSDGGNYFESNIWVESSLNYDIENKIKDIKKEYKAKTVAIQGETYGDKVQKRNYSLTNNKRAFVVFHIWIDGKRLPIREMIEICDKYNLPHVHVYDFNYKIPESVEEIISDIDKSRSNIDCGDIEGFVFYSQDGQQNFKCVSPSFLLKYHR